MGKQIHKPGVLQRPTDHEHGGDGDNRSVTEA